MIIKTLHRKLKIEEQATRTKRVNVVENVEYLIWKYVGFDE
jgi:hypothetical protein